MPHRLPKTTLKRWLFTFALAAVSSLTGCFWLFHPGTSDQGITSDTHRAHVGGMVFSGAVIKHGAENPAAFVDHCTLGQPCYARFYFAKSLRDATHNPRAGWIALRASVDGTAMPDGVFQMLGFWSTYNFTLFRASGDQQPWEHPTWFLEKVASQLQPGDHTLQIDVLAAQSGGTGVGAPIATGKITYTVPPNASQIITAAMPTERHLLALQRQREAAAWSAAGTSSSESSSSSSASSDASGEVAFNLDASECAKGWDYMLTDSEGTQTGLAQNNQELKAHGTATLCISENHNDCASNTVHISAHTKNVVVSASCARLSPQ